MDIIRLPAEMTAWSNKMITKGKTIAFVPTMGFFHEGHLSLMRMATKKADYVVVSLFVNPTQFGPQEDLSKYPRDFDRDVALAHKENIDVLFVPELSSMYPEGAQTRVIVKQLTTGLCGANRPGHFEGVTTVVAKLFNIVRPHIAIFGQKDFQQLAVIRQMVNDLNWDIDIVGHPIVREDDGLAMSSRNSYLSAEERQKALCLYKSIKYAKVKMHKDKLTDAGILVNEIQELIESHEGVQVEYISVVNSRNLTDQEEVDENSVLALAVKVGQTRLIDNDILFEGRLN